MNIGGLRKFLEDKGVRPSVYAINTVAVDDAVVLYQESEYRWLVFYMERGNRRSVRIHASEADACKDLAERALSMEEFIRRHPPRSMSR